MAKKKAKKKAAKKKKAAASKAAPEKKKKATCIQFLRDLYKKDPEVSNEKAARLLRAKFPMSKAGTKAIITWKKILRDEGMKIPINRATQKKKPAKKKTKKKSRKR